ncbi:MAG: ADP-ribosylglycohydrolase family protein [Prolixibacteraceae bacterium]|nr:ADP-ribosylglycohydrolase family protein [Prolixibacteraceae bacterium]MBN2774000.1 ADP-ribosylglycohydrolase family protein [Prolixibacteraceae bacterium]
MKKNLLLFMTVFIVTISSNANDKNRGFLISKEALNDKIKGAWAAQTIGVTFGVPVEFDYNSTLIQDYQSLVWNDSSLLVEFRERPGTYDDIYMDLSFMKVIEEHGVDAPAQLFAESFAQADYKLWFANQTARYNILNGLTPPESGHWLNNPCADDIDFQIEADFAGLMNPGMVNSAIGICDKVGHIMNYGDGYYGGVFVASMYSLALISNDPDDIEDIVKKAIAVIPAESKFHQCISDVIKWHDKNPDDWKSTWAKTSLKWSQDIGSPLGVFQPFNIDAKINSAWVVIGLLYGDGDFTRTFEIATRCGDDADCNPATAGGILAAITGFEKIPDFWKQGLDKVEDLSFMGTDISLNKAYDMSFRHALDMIKNNGGEIKNDQINIAVQEPEKVPLEIAFEGHYPKAMIFPQQTENEISFEFEGIGFAVAAPPDGKKFGRLNHVFETEMYIDGKLVEKAKLPTEINYRRFTPFYRYQLEPGKHMVLIKVLNPVEGASIELKHAIIYGDKPFKVNL